MRFEVSQIEVCNRVVLPQADQTGTLLKLKRSLSFRQSSPRQLDRPPNKFKALSDSVRKNIAAAKRQQIFKVRFESSNTTEFSMHIHPTRIQ